MTVLLLTLAVAFAALCVWLSVRIINRRERWAKWTLAVAVGVPVLYAASFGPACWIGIRDREFIDLPVYRPIAMAMYRYEIAQDVFGSYGRLLTGNDVNIAVGRDGSCWVFRLSHE